MRITSQSLHRRTDLHLARKIWHMGMGLFMALFYQFVCDRVTGVLLLGFFFSLMITLEVMRLKNMWFNSIAVRFWGPLMRKNEIHSMSGMPYYIGSVMLAVALFPKPIAVLSTLFLAFGDPIASVFGIRYGDRSIRFQNGKSLIGTLAGTVTCFIVSLMVLTAYGLSLWPVILISFIGGIAGGAAEMVPLEVDDNFSIPLVSGFVLWLSFILIGL